MNDAAINTEMVRTERVVRPSGPAATRSRVGVRVGRYVGRYVGSALAIAVVIAAIMAVRALPAKVDVVPATRGTAIEAAYATATVEARARASVRALVTGTAVEVLVREGDAVTRGQLLARLDAVGVQDEQTRVEGDVSESRAQQDTREVELGEARDEATRVRDLVERGSLAAVEQTRAEARVATLRSRLAAAVAHRRSVERRMRAHRGADGKAVSRELEVRAPMAGVVVHRNVEPGEMAVAGAELFVVADLRDPLVECVVDEEDVSRVRPGMAAVVDVRAMRGRPLAGKVVSVAEDAERDRKAFVAKIRLDDAPAGLRPGMSAEVNLVLEERPGALLVVPGAVDAQGGAWVARDGRAHRQPVDVGIRTARSVEVRAGLREGDELIVGRVDKLREGARVEATRIPWDWSPRAL